MRKASCGVGVPDTSSWRKKLFFSFLSFIRDISTVYLSRKYRRFLAKGERTLLEIGSISS